MDTIFLACFVFGALFTAASALLGFGAAHGGPALHHGPVAHGHAPPHADGGHAHGGDSHELPLFNASSLLAFLTLFGAAGYILHHYADWVLLPALIGAVVAGLVGWVLIALLLRKLLAGQSAMNPDDYRLEGTIGRVTVSIPPGGTGEIVFSKAGAYRSEAARGIDQRPIPHGAEVVVTHYERGFATVQPWAEFVASSGTGPQAADAQALGRLGSLPPTHQEQPSEAQAGG
jgi:hypothetical protein